MIKRFFNIFLMFLFNHAAFAGIFYVAVAGSDISGDGSESNPFASIQRGINTSLDSDTVLVLPGRYYENINYLGKDIVVGSLFLTLEDTSYIGQTVIDGNSEGPVITIAAGEGNTSVLMGFTITNGLSENGGGIYCYGSSPHIIFNRIIANTATNWGGGLCFDQSSLAVISNCEIENNTAAYGGGIFCELNSDIEIYETRIRGNNGSILGGAFYCTEANPIFNRVIVEGNSANAHGGIYFHGTENIETYLTNVTIVGNSAALGGGLSSTHENTILIVNNCIIWDNTPAQVYEELGSLTINYSTVQNGWVGTGNIDNDPLFIDAEVGNFHLDSSSPCIDAGNPDLDGDGENWELDPDDQDPDGSRLDMGSRYFHHLPPYGGTVLYVSTQGSDSLGNGSAEWPYYSIQMAVNDASEHDTIAISQGTYHENIIIDTTPVTLSSLASLLGTSDQFESPCISGSGVGTTITVRNINEAIIIQGLNIENGFAEYGGGISAHNVNGVYLFDIILSANYAEYGGGLFADSSQVYIFDSKIQNNEALTHGGGIFLKSCSSELRRVVVNNNSVETASGGGLYFDNSEIQLINATVFGNTAAYVGGVFGTGNASITAFNCIFNANSYHEIYLVNAGINVYFSAISDPETAIGWDDTFTHPVILDTLSCILTDPGFNAPAEGDFTLRSDSPCIDAGNPDPDGDGSTWEIDIDDQDPDGTRMDMGAYYYHHYPVFPGTPPDTLWTRRFGDPSVSEEGKSVQATSDGGLIIGGTVSSTETAHDFRLIKTNQTGIIEWSESYGGIGDEILRSVIPTNDGGFIATGYTAQLPGGASEVWVLKVDSAGTEEWNNTYCDDCNGGGYEIVQASDDSYIVAGGIGDAFIVKILPNGDQDWESIISTPEYTEAVYSVVSLEDNGFALAGKQWTPEGYFSTVLIKTDAAGNEEWRELYDWGDNAQGNAIIQSDDGGFVIGGAIEIDGDVQAFIQKLDNVGELQWRRIYGGQGNEIGSAIVLTLARGFAVAGVTYSDTYGEGDFYVFQTDSLGTPEWETHLGGMYHDAASGITTTDDGGLVVVGSTRSTDSDVEVPNDMWLIKIGGEETDPAYEGPVWHVSVDGSDVTGDGSEVNPFASIQLGIDFSANGDTVLVEPGTYLENINLDGKNICLASKYLSTTDTSYISTTVIDGNAINSVVTVESGEDSTCHIIGFTIQNGMTLGSDGLNEGYGGGICIKNFSAPVLSHLRIKLNHADYEGAGIYVAWSQPTLKKIEVSSNQCSGAGAGGISITAFSTVIIDSAKISGNAGSRGGISITGNENSVDISRTVISNNFGYSGAGLHISGVADGISDVNMRNVTITDNVASSNAGGVSCGQDGVVNIVNSIIWGNQPDQLYKHHPLSIIDASFSDVEGGYLGISNLDLDPLFDTEPGVEYSLSQTSPCIDAGNPDFDNDGDTWEVDSDDQDPDGTRIDIGAYYFEQSGTFPSIVVTPQSLNFTVSLLDSAQQTKELVFTNSGTDTLRGEVILNSHSLEDIDGNIYPSVLIGEQEWMARNLNVTKYRNGAPIPNITDGEEWMNMNSGAYCYYNNDSLNYGNLYGALYNWYGVADEQVLAPEGWHVPTDTEWKQLEMELGMSQGDADNTGHRGDSEGAQLAGGMEYWINGNLVNHPNFGASGFNALPGGVRNGSSFSGETSWAYFLTTTEYDASSTFTRGIHSFDTQVDRDYDPKTNGYSVRCIKDENSQLVDWIIGGYQFLKIAPGESDTLAVSIDVAELPNGNYTDTLIVISNDPITSIISIPVTLDKNITDQPYSGPIWFVSIEGSDDSGDGSISSPFGTIQKAADEAGQRDTISVGPGTYFNEISIQDKSLTIIGADTSSSLIETSLIYVGSTTSQSVSFSKIKFGSNGTTQPMLSADCYECNSGDTLVLSLSEISVDGNSEKSFIRILRNVHLSIDESTLQNLSAGGDAAAVQLNGLQANKSLHLSNSRFINCSSNGMGGAVYAEFSNNILIENTYFIGNYSGTQHADQGGGAICLKNSTATVNYSQFINNSSNSSGGAIHLISSYFNLDHSVFVGNSAGLDGQAIRVIAGSFCEISFSSFGENSTAGPGISFQGGCTLFINNSIVWGSTNYQISNSNVAGQTMTQCSLAVDFSNIKNAQSGILDQTGELQLSWGDGNIDILPEYFSGTNLTLQGSSPCIDAGDPDYNGNGDFWEIDPEDQDPDGTRLDMGAYYFDQTDTESPTVSLNPDILEPQIGTGEILLLEWSASDNQSLGDGIVSFSADLTQPFQILDTLTAVGEWYGFLWRVPDIVSQYCRLAIKVEDYAGNVGTDTTEFFEIIDGTVPWVNSIVIDTPAFEGDSLRLSWDVEDNIALSTIELAFTNHPQFPFEQIEEFSGSTSAFAFPLGPIVSDSARVRLVVRDASENEGMGYSEYFRIYDNTPPIVTYLQPTINSNFGIGSAVNLVSISTDNVGVERVKYEYSTDAGETWTHIRTLSLIRSDTTSVSWGVPNIPGSCWIRVTAYDAVELSTSDISDEFQIIIEYPVVNTHTSQIWPVEDVNVSFNQVIMPDDLTEAISVQPINSHPASYTMTIDSTSLTIAAYDGFWSMDTLQIILNADLVRNIYGYGLDGNADGIFDSAPVDNDTLLVIVNAAGDYVEPFGQIDFDDFAVFVDAWFAEDFSYELAPSQNDIPRISIQPDSVFNIYDLATFAAMWNWVWELRGASVPTSSFPIVPIEYNQEGNTVQVVLPAIQGNAEQIVLSYNPAEVKVSLTTQSLNKVSSTNLQLFNELSDRGQLVLTRSLDSLVNEHILNLTLEPQSRFQYHIEVAYQVSGESRVRGRHSMEIQSIPNQFFVQDNYPNPFNASTTIEYGLPKESEVQIAIYDVRGRFVKEIYSGTLAAGYHVAHWHGVSEFGDQMASGLYFIVLSTPKYRVAQKAIILK